MNNMLYQFFPNSEHGNSDTLQIMQSQRAWLELVSTIISQIKDNISDDEPLRLEVTGRMIVTGEEG